MDRSENPFLYTIRLPVRTPNSIVISLVVVHIISFVLPWFTNLDGLIKLVVSGFVLLSLGYHFYCSKKGPTKVLSLNREDQWSVSVDGKTYYAEPGPTQFAHPCLTIISLKYEMRTAYFVFTPETINAEQLRRLRVRLRFKLNKDA